LTKRNDQAEARKSPNSAAVDAMQTVLERPLSNARNSPADNGIGATCAAAAAKRWDHVNHCVVSLGAGNHLRLKSWKSAIIKSAVNPRCSYIKGFERQ
jgi:hypothetical protein